MTGLTNRIADVLLVEPTIIDADPHKPAICRLSDGSPRISMPLLKAEVVHRGRTPLHNVPPTPAHIVRRIATPTVHPAPIAGADLVAYVRRPIVQLCAGRTISQQHQLGPHNVRCNRLDVPSRQIRHYGPMDWRKAVE